jgi:hypothetical protein
MAIFASFARDTLIPLVAATTMVESFRGLRKFFNTKSSDAARAKSAKGAKFWIIVHFLCVLRVLCARCPIFGCAFAALCPLWLILALLT